MKFKMSMKKAIAIFAPCITVVVAIMLALIIAATMFYKDISLWLYGRKQTVDAKALASGSALCEDIVEEGIVLLKNDNNALPLSKSEVAKVNVFGWAAYDWMTSAFGSGYSNTRLPKVKLFPALEAAGIEYNTDLYDMYKEYYSAKSNVYNKDEDEQEYRGGVSFGSEEIFTLREPSKADYEKHTDSIKAFSKVALVVIGRTGSESKDLSLQQVKQTTSGKNTTSTTDTRHYLQLSTEEEDMIAVAEETCDKVIVILNTANTMETGFIDDPDIDAALLVGITGLTGVNGLVNVLRGEKPQKALDKDGNIQYDADNNIIYETNADGSYVMEKVSPSGRTADTYAYDIRKTNPATLNQGQTGSAKKYSSGVGDGNQDNYVDYSEGIYVGYKWYETANKDGFWDTEEYGGYEKVVQYPFGYGLSYTNFKWTVTHAYLNEDTKDEKEINLDGVTALGKNDVISVYVQVENMTEYPGMDVVELYYTAPYKDGEIEKAFVNLGDFAKTGVIPANGSDIVRLELSVQDMASYDCYDANNNSHTGYELDGGDYELKLMKNAHEFGDMADGASAVIKCSLPSTGYNYDTDGKTGNEVANRFTNKDGKGNDQVIDDNDLDGSRESTPVKYLTRADFKTSFNEIKITTARSLTAEALAVAKQMDPTDKQLAYAGYADAPTRTSSSNGLKWSDVIDDPDALDYDNEIWDDLIQNLSNYELSIIVGDGYFKTAKVPSIDKPEYVDLDGPLGMNTRVTAGTAGCQYVAYPSPTILAQTWSENMAHQMGLSVGNEADKEHGVYGWYAPGANIHRSPFGGRNGEYYSEDGVLSGKICAQTVKGAKENGVYSYMKHFVCNDSELERNGLFTFLTEQTLRETYLRPFEIAVKTGGGNALMTSMNRLGRVWSGGNYGLMTEIVRNEWGFHGCAVTDWIAPGNSIYMPPYRGIWAGNDIWLTNGVKDTSGNMHLSQIDALVSSNDAAGLAIMEKVARDVLWTFVDTVNYSPDSADIDYSKGAVYTLTWVWYVVLVEVVLAAGVGVMAFFLVKSILANKKTAVETTATESTDETPLQE